MTLPTAPIALFPIGVRFILMSTLGFALMSATVKWVSYHGIPVFEIVAARALVSLIISYLDVKRKGLSIWGNNKPLLLARGTVGTLALMCVYYALTTIPLAEATILQYTYPLFTSLLAVLFLKERIQLTTMICIALSLLGLWCVIQPALDFQTAHQLPLFSVVMALLGAAGSSIAYVLVRKLSQTEDSSVIIFYFPLVALPISLIMMGDSFVWPDLTLTVLLVLVGIFTQIGQLGLTKAMKTLTAGNASALGYIQIVFTTLIGVVMFDEIPVTWTYVGGALIIAGALINVFGARLLQQRRGRKT
jgi:drug/metabolite transporter (DMT)-like permease